MSREKRLAALEAARRAWAADHSPADEAYTALFDLLATVSKEGRAETAQRLLWQIVAIKAERVEALYLAEAARL